MTNGEKILNKLIELEGDKIDLVFMPYHASMWDSMESVFDAWIKRNPYPLFCPIPYKARNESEWRLDFDFTVSLLPLRNAKPNEIAVIHYPYDNYNRATEIRPDYYSSSLKKKGYKIAYIPYSCTIHDAGYGLTPAVRFADYVFVNDEAERQLYIDAWREYDVDFSDKIFALGSPKFDAVKKKRDVVIPSTWDVFGKEIALICSSLIPILNDADRFKKHREIIKAELSNGSAVIYRPHPLTLATLETMRPHQVAEYNDFIEWVKSVCILDDTGDLNRAIYISTRLYSDPSSIVDLYKETGKPCIVI